MITRREMFKRLAVMMGAVALTDTFIDNAVDIVWSKPLGPFISRLSVVNEGEGLTYIGLPGMNTNTMEGVFCWLERDVQVSVDLSKVPEVRLSDFAIEGGDPVVSWIAHDQIL
jgi:hypothetical protein